MACRKSFLSKPSYTFPSTNPETHFNPKSSEGGAMLEFDEADLWNMSISNNTNIIINNNNSNSNDHEANKKALSGSRSALKRGSRKVDVVASAATSLPVNIPDWSKILKEEYKEHPKWESDDDYDDDEDEDDGGDHDVKGNHHHHHHHGGIRVPPHEYLARTRGASLSVHEGIGRTLKGRDLRSVRNAIWKKVGFED